MSNKRPLSSFQKENVEYSNNVEKFESETSKTKSRNKTQSESPESEKENITDGNSSVSEYVSSNYSSPQSSDSDIKCETQRRDIFHHASFRSSKIVAHPVESGSNDTNQGEHLKRNSKTEVDSKKRKFDNDSGFLTEMFQNQGNKPVKEYCAG